MKAILHKTGEDFILKDEEGETLAITFEGGNKSGRTLSLKNCQAIELGYDLDELWKETIFSKNISINSDIGNSFKKGFQKALEILGDKKFSESDMLTAMYRTYCYMLPETGGQTDIIDGKTHFYSCLEDLQTKYIQSLQQTEWEVEVEMYVSENYVETDIPKLDENNCLILKRL